MKRLGTGDRYCCISDGQQQVAWPNQEPHAFQAGGVSEIGIMVLTVATALIHLSRGLALGAPSLRPFPLLFYLNCLGYLVLLIALYVPQLLSIRRTIRWTLIIYTALTIVLWMVITRFHSVFIGYIDKPIELALIVLLLIEDRQAHQRRV